MKISKREGGDRA